MWEVLAKEVPTPSAPKFQFENTIEAAEFNAVVLEKHKFDLHSALRGEKNSPMRYGSEFRNINELGKIFGTHEYWAEAATILQKGVHYPVEKISKKTRLAQSAAVRVKGNHKSAQENPAKVEELSGKT